MQQRGFYQNYVNTWVLEDRDSTSTNEEKLFFISCEWRKKEMEDEEKNYQFATWLRPILSFIQHVFIACLNPLYLWIEFVEIVLLPIKIKLLFILLVKAIFISQ